MRLRRVTTLLFSLSLLIGLSASAEPDSSDLTFDVRYVYTLAEGTGYVSNGHYDANCSGSLVRFEDSSLNDKAFVLTAGHCVMDGFGSTKFMLGRPAREGNVSTFTIFDFYGQIAGGLTLDRIVYASVEKSDIALISLTDSYQDIQHKIKVRPFTISSQHPQVGQAFRFFRSSPLGQELNTCSADFFVPKLSEGIHAMEDSIRYAKAADCSAFSGSSGAGLILNETRTLIGVNSTRNVSGEKCTEDNPCEIMNDGSIIIDQGRSYGQQTYLLYSCLNEHHEFDGNKDGCKLEH